MTETCYACNHIATTVEHAPPRCIFPERKDLPDGVDHRKNLITVPACEAHNTDRSGDDEYLLYALPASIGSNETGQNLLLTKVKRAHARRSSLGNSLMQGAKEVILHDTESDIWSKAIAMPLDIARIDSVLEMNARAIYFHHYLARFSGTMQIFKNFLLSLEDPGLNDTIEQMFKGSDEIFAAISPLGSNPEVFIYKFARNESMELLEFTFYGKNKVLFVFSHSSLGGAAGEV